MPDHSSIYIADARPRTYSLPADLDALVSDAMDLIDRRARIYLADAERHVSHAVTAREDDRGDVYLRVHVTHSCVPLPADETRLWSAATYPGSVPDPSDPWARIADRRGDWIGDIAPDGCPSQYVPFDPSGQWDDHREPAPYWRRFRLDLSRGGWTAEEEYSPYPPREEIRARLIDAFLPHLVA